MSDLDSLARIPVSSYPLCLHYKYEIRNQSPACEEFFFILDPVGVYLSICRDVNSVH